MRLVSRFDDLLFPMLLLTLALSSSGLAQTATVHVSDFHATLDIAKNGSAIVVERWDLAAPVTSGLRRALPLEVSDPNHVRSRVFMNVIRVTDEANRPRKFSTRIWNGQLEITVPLAASTSLQTAEISYRIRNLVRYYGDHDEIYWDLLQADFTPDHASAMFILPDAAADGLRARGFVGNRDTAMNPQIHKAAVEFESAAAIPTRAPFVVDIFVPGGVFLQPSWFVRAAWFLDANPIIVLPVVVLLFTYAAYALKRGAPAVVATEYEPPINLTPAEVGMLVDDRFDPRDVTATLIDLAVRGYLRIEEDRDSSLQHRDYILRIVKCHDQWHDLANHERAMMFNIFYGGQWTKLSSLRLRFAIAVPAMRAGVLNKLLDKGLYRFDPQAAHKYRIALLEIAGVLFLIAQLLGLISLFQSLTLAVAVFAVSAAIVYWFGRSISAKTLKGMRVCAQIEGFRDFLNRVAADRLERVAPDKFEKYLPYAMALGVEHHWVETFAGITRVVPDWYQVVGDEAIAPKLWAAGMALMANQASSILSAVPRSGFFGSRHPSRTAIAPVTGRS